jgi:hypothetical protein
MARLSVLRFRRKDRRSTTSLVEAAEITTCDCNIAPWNECQNTQYPMISDGIVPFGRLRASARSFSKHRQNNPQTFGRRAGMGDFDMNS